MKWDNLPYLPYFTHDAIVNDWPPGWLPSDDWGINHAKASAVASEQRGVQVARGNLGTIGGISAKSDKRLRDIPRAPGWINKGKS